MSEPIITKITEQSLQEYLAEQKRRRQVMAAISGDYDICGEHWPYASRWCRRCRRIHGITLQASTSHENALNDNL